MSKVRVANFSLSIDGFGAGPAQSLEHPLGENGMELHEWLFDTQTFRKMQGDEGGGTGVDDNFAARGLPWAIAARSASRERRRRT